MPLPALTPQSLAALVTSIFPDGRVPLTGEGIRQTAYAICRAESGGIPDRVGDTGPNVCRSPSFGLWQINPGCNPRFAGFDLFDPLSNARAALDLSRGGTSWLAWCTWVRQACGGNGNAAYRGYLTEADQAISGRIPSCSGCGPFRITAVGGLQIRSGPGTEFPSIGLVPDTGLICIACQQRGSTAVSGSSIWDRLPDGGWVSDFYLSTPAFNDFSPGCPRCGEIPPPPPTPPPPGTAPNLLPTLGLAALGLALVAAGLRRPR